jgi:hypothetical protein
MELSRKCTGLAFATAGTLVYALGQLFSLVFPFVSFGLFYSRQNLLQTFCFYATAASALLVLLLLPSAYQYAWFCLEVRFFRFRNWFDVFNISKAIQEYHVPPQQYLLRMMIPAELLPTDVVGVIASLLPPNALDLADLSIQQCRDIKERMLDPTGVPDSDEQAAVFIRQHSSEVANENIGVQPASGSGPAYVGYGSTNSLGSRQISDVEGI